MRLRTIRYTVVTDCTFVFMACQKSIRREFLWYTSFHLRIIRLTRFRVILRKFCHLLCGIRNTLLRIQWICGFHKKEFLAKKTYWYRSTFFLSLQQNSCWSCHQSGRKKTQRGRFLRTKDFFACGRSDKFNVFLFQHYSICLHWQLLSTGFWHGYGLSSIGRHCQFGNGRF